MSQTDEEIILSYKNGNKEALKELIDKYYSPIYNFTARLTTRSEAPDIVQDVFVKTWKNIDNFSPEKASFKTWLFTVAKNTVTDFLRKKKSITFSDMEKIANQNKEDDSSFAENIPSAEILPDQYMQKLDDSKLLNEMLEKLNLEYREVLILHYQEEMTFDEIGKVLNKPLNTVKSQHRRAIIELRKMLE